jgi:hypothetical protein
MDLKNPTRTEALLANIAGHTDVPVPDMKNATRSERLLKEILDNGGGGGGGDVTKEYVDTAIANAVVDIDDDISALSDTVADKVDKVNGKSLSTNDYTDADKALVQDSPITVTATASPIPTANGKPRAITIYGKSEIVDSTIKSAGEGWSTVDLGTLTWTKNIQTLSGIDYIYWSCYFPDIRRPSQGGLTATWIMCNNYETMRSTNIVSNPSTIGVQPNGNVLVSTENVTDDTTKPTGILCYELADPTQGNAIAVKTDDGTGIDGTMATFTTGTPLYGISDSVRDIMTWNGSAGEVMKNCRKTAITGTDNLNKWQSAANGFYASLGLPTKTTPENRPMSAISNVAVKSRDELIISNDVAIGCNATGSNFLLIIPNATTIEEAQAYLQNNPIYVIYELATPTTEPLTQTENESLAGLKTYAPQTTVTINDNPDYSIEAYANTANGQAISDMQPTRSPLLTLSASGWTNNAQTVTYEHDTGKRNSIDVEPTSIKAWTAAGILATAETATNITFECDTVPTADLSFRVTSMEVR